MKTKILSFLTALVLTTPALADDPPDFVAAEKVQEAASKAVEDGWKLSLSLGTNASLNDNHQVVGSTDGTTFQLGVVINGNANLRAGQHEWENGLTIEHQQTKTPEIDPFVKSLDNAELTTMYLYRLASIEWLGPFARARAQTQLFPGYLIRAGDEKVKKTDTNGDSTVTDLAAQEKLQVTDPFEPFLLRESAGAFARPYDSEKLKLTFTAGAGGIQIFADGGYVLKDDDGTEELDMFELESSNQLGAEVDVEASGALSTSVTWGVSANLMYPFIVSVDTDFEGMDLLNREFGAKLSLKLSSWASLDYVLKAKKLPLVVNDWQVQNSLLLSSAFNLI